MKKKSIPSLLKKMQVIVKIFSTEKVAFAKLIFWP